jgi:hypothetical protein
MDIEKYAQEHIFPSRSRYQLENFVVRQHDTPAMQWKQVLLEGQQLAYNIKSAELNIKKTQIEMERLLETGDEIDAIDAEQKRLDIILTERTLAGAKIELNWLEDIAQQIGVHSFEQVEADQPKYWQLRLQRQADTDALSQVEGVSPSNIASMINAGIIEYKKEETNEIPNLEA